MAGLGSVFTFERACVALSHALWGLPARLPGGVVEEVSVVDVVSELCCCATRRERTGAASSWRTESPSRTRPGLPVQTITYIRDTRVRTMTE
jgi:hypothetical protein